MKFKDIKTTQEEVVQFVKDAGVEFLDPENVESNGHTTLQEQLGWVENRLRMLNDLYNIAVELDARETSSNCVIGELINLSWVEVCDKGIELLEKLKEPWKEIR